MKNHFFEGCCWFKFNNLGLALDVALKFYTNVPKVLKLKVRIFLEPVPTIVEIIGGKLVGADFCHQPQPPLPPLLLHIL